MGPYFVDLCDLSNFFCGCLCSLSLPRGACSVLL